MTVRIPLHSIQPSEGHVECTVMHEGQAHKGFIEQSFFDDASGGRVLNPQQKRDLVINSLPYLQKKADELLERGQQDVHIA